MSRFKDTSFQDKKALIRVDFNVPLADGEVTDDTRIRAAIPTIKHVLDQGGSCILMSHLGRPKNREEEFSLSQVIGCLENLVGRTVAFANDCIGEEAENKAKELKAGEVLLLENLRYHSAEKAGDKDFAQKLAGLGDIYVNDAFGTAHRAHASTAVIAQFMEVCLPGFVMESEVGNIEQVLEKPERPFTAIVGGAKVSSKISVLKNLIGRVDHLIIGGGMAYTFIKANGGSVGGSLIEEDYLDEARRLMAKAAEANTSIHLPADSVAADAFSESANTQVISSDAIADGWMGLDVGPMAITTFKKVISESKTILWNGPMGVFEMDAFSKGTVEIAQEVAHATRRGAYSLVGGGDSVAAINKFELAEQVSYISTGGGAMLESLEGKTLPGVAAVMPSRIKS